MSKITLKYVWTRLLASYVLDNICVQFRLYEFDLVSVVVKLELSLSVTTRNLGDSLSRLCRLSVSASVNLHMEG